MTRQPSSRREEPTAQKDLKKLQQQEQRILAKLAEAREAQANALKRFAQAQARVLLVEGRLQAVRARLQTPQASPDNIQEAGPSPTSTPDARETGAQTTTSAPEPATSTSAEANIAQKDATRTAEMRRAADQHPQPMPVLEFSRRHNNRPTDEAELLSLVPETSAGVPIETLPQTGELLAPDVLAEDLEETARRAAFPAMPSATPTPQEKRRDQEEEDALIAAIMALTHSETEIQDETENSTRRAEQALNEVNLAILNGTLSGPEADNALREAEANLSQTRAQLVESGTSPTPKAVADEPDITDKLPVMHDRDARTQEPI